MFLLVPAYPGCPGSKAVKRSSLLLLTQMSTKRNSGRRLTGKQVPEVLFSLPSNDGDSDTEADAGSKEELQNLESSTTQLSDTGPRSPPTVLLDNHDDVEPTNIDDDDDSDIEQSNDDDGQWLHELSKHFRNLHPLCAHSAEITASLSSRDSPQSYFKLIFDKDICDLIVDQTNLYSAQKAAASTNCSKGGRKCHVTLFWTCGCD